jgi:hypothetical protein
MADPLKMTAIAEDNFEYEFIDYPFPLKIGFSISNPQIIVSNFFPV